MTLWTKRRTARSIIDVLQDQRLLGALPCFTDLSTWANWIVFLKATYGLSMTSKEEKIFCRHTGRSRYRPVPVGYAEAVAICGRQSGKDRVGSVIQDYEAMSATKQQDGTEVYALSIAQDQRSSLRTAFRYASAPFETIETLKNSVIAQRAGAWTLENGVILASYPCRPEAVRGLRAVVVVCSELAFYRNSENAPVDTEMLRAVRPCLATTSGRLIILSSPYGQSGALWDLHRKHFGRDDASVLVWQASAPDMNPTLPRDYLDRMQQDDPEAYRSEVLGEFRAGLSSFLDPSVIEACVESGVRERVPGPGIHYRSFIDSASGSGKDQFTVAISHAEGQRVVLDVVRAWPPPFNPSSVIAEAAALLTSYGLRFTQGDRYSPGFVREGFAAHEISYQFCEQDRSAIYLEVLPLLNAGQAVLLDLPELLRELRGLERRRGTSGRDRIDHVPGSHDDLANAAAGAVVLAAKRASQPPLILRCNGVTISSAPAPSLLDRISDKVAAALSSGVASVKAAVSTVADTVNHTEPQVFPTVDGRRRTIPEIESLSEGCRSREEQQRLDQHNEQQRRNVEFEATVKARGLIGWFPGEGVQGVRAPFDSETLEAIRQQFEQWR